MKIAYLSHGEYQTGGYYLEQSLCGALGPFTEKRFRRKYQGLVAWGSLFLHTFFAAKGEVMVTVSRLAWPVYLRNIFNRNKIILVLHNYDRRDGKPGLYYWLLDRFLKLAARKENKIAVVVVAGHWKTYFQNNFAIRDNIFVFPNMMDNAMLAGYAKVSEKKEKLVHFGQYSEKADLHFYRILAAALKMKGYFCYFSSAIPVKYSELPVIYFDTHAAYLEKMSAACCTVIVNKINEGWNRVAQESFLVGTQVISNGGGGLGELIQMAKGYMETDVQEIINLLEKGVWQSIDYQSLSALDISKISDYAKPILHWMNQP